MGLERGGRVAVRGGKTTPRFRRPREDGESVSRRFLLFSTGIEERNGWTSGRSRFRLPRIWLSPRVRRVDRLILKPGSKSGFDRRGGVGYTTLLGVSLCRAWTDFSSNGGQRSVDRCDVVVTLREQVWSLQFDCGSLSLMGDR